MISKKIARNKAFNYVLVTLFVLLLSSFSFAQTDSISNQTDLIDVTRSALKIKAVDSTHQKETPVYFSVLPCLGYAIQNGVSAVLISNISFYLGNKNDNISAISVIGEYTQYKQIMVPINIDIWTKGNKWNFTADWRYYDYNVFNYGLGGNTPLLAKEGVAYNYIRIYQYALHQISKDFLAGIGYNLDYHFNINRTEADSHPNSDLVKYGYSNKSVSSGLSASLLYDNRRNSNNPTGGGTYANIIYRMNPSLLGSDNNWQSLFFDFRKYFSLSKKSKNILGFWGMGNIIIDGKPPYFDLPAIGWDTYTNASRQFRQGRYIGKHLLYFESEYRFQISKNGLFNGGIFANAQSVSNWPSNKLQKVIPGIGISLRTKLNKRSNINLICSYGIASDGSQGLFFNLGEVF